MIDKHTGTGERHVAPLEKDDERRVGAPGDLDNRVRQFIERFDFHYHPELHEASLAVIDGLMNDELDKERLRLAWSEFAQIAEQIVESTEVTPDDPNAYTRRRLRRYCIKPFCFKLQARRSDT